MDPFISVIVTTYNSSKFVVQTLESIKEQNYSNLELIVSDDSSTDDTVLICDNWIKENKYIFKNTILIISPFNTGLTKNSNRAFNAANGEWIKYIEGDDLLHRDCIQHYLNYIKTFTFEDISILIAKAIAFTTQIPDFSIKEEVDKDKRPYYHMKKYDPYANFNIATPTLFIKRELWLKYKFDERFPMLWDVAFWWELLRDGNKIYRVPKHTIYYRIHNQSITHQKKNKSSNIKYAADKLNAYVLLRRKHIPFFYRMEADFVHLQYRLILLLKGKYANIIYFIFGKAHRFIPTSIIMKFKNK